MKNKLIAVVTALVLIPSIYGSHSSTFKPYSVTINNNSGGLLEVKNTRGLTGVSHKTDIEAGQSATAMVKKRGSRLQVVAGQENNKKKYNVAFFNKMQGAHHPSITISETGIMPTGFYTQEKSYKVVINNQSAGFARILDAADATGKGMQIASRQSASITVKPDAHILIETGPEKRKVVYKIQFADQTGKNPTIQLNNRSFVSNGIRATDVEVKTNRTSKAMRPNLEARITHQHLEKIKHTRKTPENNLEISKKPTMKEARRVYTYRNANQ